MSCRALVVALGFVVLVPLVAGAQIAAEEAGLQAVGAFEQGKLYRAGPVSVVRVQGTYRQMGRQYGRLLRPELERLYGVAIQDEYLSRQGYTAAQLHDVAEQLFAHYPHRYREIVLGMAETSGLGRDKQVILNAVEWIPKLALPAAHCSGLAVWGDYTGSGPLLFGRNNDDTAFFKRFAPYVVVVVLDPRDGSIPVAIVNYAGVVYAPSGMNAAGLFLELNSGNSMGYFPDRVSVFTTLVSFLQDYETLDEVEPAFKSIKPELSSIVNGADLASAASFECSPAEARRRAPDKPGVMAATNHFVDPAWGLPLPDDQANALTVTRREHLLEQAEAHKGRFSVATMKEVLETTIEHGGATDAATTIYQILAEPETLTIWLRAPDNFEWQRIRLSRLLRPGGSGSSTD
jgi:hypothetical protein